MIWANGPPPTLMCCWRSADARFWTAATGFYYPYVRSGQRTFIKGGDSSRPTGFGGSATDDHPKKDLSSISLVLFGTVIGILT
jgi:hypothetical protein